MSDTREHYFPRPSPVPPGIVYRREVHTERVFAGSEDPTIYLKYKKAADARHHHEEQAEGLTLLNTTLQQIVQAIGQANTSALQRLLSMDITLTEIEEKI